MKDDKRNPQEENQTNLRKVSRKRWFYPAVYLCVAALIMSGVLWMENGIGGHNKANNQNPSANNIASKQPTNNQDAVPVNSASSEVLKWPVADKSQVSIAQKFYDPNASQADQVAALVNYDNTYAPNTGINLVAKDKKTFDVTAALSGTVTRADKDNLFGYVVELNNGNGVSTLYESLASIDVKKGDHVDQGQLLGQAGTEVYNKAMGTHLHFEVRKNEVPVNPTAFWNQKTSAVTAKTTSAKTSSKVSSDQSSSSNQGSSNSNQGQSGSSDNSNSNNNMNSDNSSSQQ